MNNIEELFVPYQEALALKELGFNEPCFTWYKNSKMSSVSKWVCILKNEDITNLTSEIILAPLYQQAFKFLYQKLGRDEFGVMPVDTNKCIEELKRLIRIVKKNEK
jgi:hypothetical protein